MPIVILTLEQAAELVGMKPAALRIKAKSGIIPGAKPGKNWVFIQSDLIDYIRGLYLSNGERILKDKKWQYETKNSISEAKSGGTGSLIQELRNKRESLRKQQIGY